MDDLIKNGVKPSSKPRKKNTIILPKGLSSILNSNNQPDFLTTPKNLLKSPRDETPIVINGEVVDVEKSIQDRIDKVTSPSIKPISPPKFPNLNIDPTIPTPAVLPYNPVNIIESESENEAVPAPNINMDFSSLLLGAQHTPPKFVQEALREKDILEETHEEVTFKKESPLEIKEIPKALPLPMSLTSLLSKKEEPKIIEPIISESKSHSSESEIEQKPVILPPKLPTPPQIEEPFFPDSSKSSSPETVYKEATPVPVFSYKARAVSPIQTLNAPKSPSPRPKFTTEGRSSAPSTPPILPIKTEDVKSNNYPNNRPTVASLATSAISAAMNEAPRVKSPYNRPTSPLTRNIATIRESSSPISNEIPREVVISPKRQALSPQRTQYYQQNTYEPQSSNNNEIMPSPVYIPPQYQDQRYMANMKPDYSRLSAEQQLYLKSEFKVKFSILRANYPQWQIVEIHDSFTLDQISDLYEYYIRQIMVTKESGNYKVYLVVFFMVVEVIGVKILKLNMSGYTMSQLRRMHQYDQLLIELGEKWLVDGGSNWPVEARLLMTATFNAVIFLGVKYLCNWMGVEGLSDTIQNFLDAMINGPENSMNNQQSYIAPQAGAIPQSIPKNAAQNTTSGAEQQQNNGNPLDGIASMFGGLFGGNKTSGASGGGAGGFADTIAQLGTAFTSKMQENNKAKASAPVNKPVNKIPIKKKLNKKSLFSD
jgi:hypothetical protein